jgi:hypothetical protein
MDQRPRILVIEDEMLLAMYLANLVEDLGYSAVGPSVESSQLSLS